MFPAYVKFRLTTRVMCFYIRVIHLSFPYDFKDNLWAGLGEGVGIGHNFRKGMLIQDQQNMLIQEKGLTFTKMCGDFPT